MFYCNYSPKGTKNKPSYVTNRISINKCCKTQLYIRPLNCGVRDSKTELHKEYFMIPTCMLLI